MCCSAIILGANKWINATKIYTLLSTLWSPYLWLNAISYLSALSWVSGDMSVSRLEDCMKGIALIITNRGDNHGKPSDWSLSVGLPLLLWGEVNRHWTLRWSQTTCVLMERDLTMAVFQQRSGKRSESRGIHCLTGRGRSWGFYSVQPMEDSVWNKAATDEERLKPCENMWPFQNIWTV